MLSGTLFEKFCECYNFSSRNDLLEFNNNYNSPFFFVKFFSQLYSKLDWVKTLNLIHFKFISIVFFNCFANLAKIYVDSPVVFL